MTTRPCLESIALCLMLLSMVARAQEVGEPPCYPKDPRRPHATRHVFVRSDPARQVEKIYVAGGVATLLRLPSKVNARRTVIGGGGDQEVVLLAGGEWILLSPARDLARGEGFPLFVALADGTAIPLRLTNPPKGESTDGEVGIHLVRDREKPAELRAQLVSMTEKARGFEISLRRALTEQQSEDYALAGLLAAQKAHLTSFTKVKERSLAHPNRKVTVETFAPGRGLDHLTDKVAAVFVIYNREAEPLQLTSNGIYSSGLGLHVPYALRAQPDVIPPNGEGRIAVVVDRASFGSDGKLALSFSKREGGEILVSIDLISDDFAAPKPSSWLPW